MSKRLLLADDSLTIQKVVGITLANEEYDLQAFGDGDAAFDAACADRPDLILADVHMPGKNGYELCAAVKQDPALKQVPVLLLTGTFEPFDEEKARRSGADGWISKPFESQALIDRVEELLARQPLPEMPAAPEAPPLTPAAAAAGVAPLEADLWEELDSGEGVSLAPEAGFAGQEEMTSDWGAVSLSEIPDMESPEPSIRATDLWQPLDDQSDPVESAEGGWLEEEDSASLAEGEDESFLFDEGVVPAEDDAVPVDEEDTFLFDEETAEETGGSSEDDVAFWASADDEILALDESDIIAEEDLEEVEGFGDEGPEVVFAEELPVTAEAQPEREALSAFEEVSPLEDYAPFSADAVDAEDAEDAEAGWGQIFGAEPEVVNPEPEVETEAWSAEESSSVSISAQAPLAEEVVPQAAIAAVAAAPVEAQVRALSEEQLEAMVERVAGAVIERLAATLLEKIAWEVVPDLAESLIKEEIRKIKEGVNLSA